MSALEAEGQAARRELERLLESALFIRNERLSRFLRFVVEARLEGRTQELKESVVAIEVFGRKPDYDPRRDPIVRTEATRLRARLSQYYTAEGRGDPLVIELPRGGYIPVFRQADATLERVSQSSRPLMIAMSALAIIAAVTGWWWIQPKSALIPIAVLPLINLSQESANDYFADGL